MHVYCLKACSRTGSVTPPPQLPPGPQPAPTHTTTTTTPQVSIALRPQRDVAIMLLAKVLVGVRGCPSYHVLELEVELPKYACYAAMDKTRCGARGRDWLLGPGACVKSVDIVLVSRAALRLAPSATATTSSESVSCAAVRCTYRNALDVQLR